MTNAVDIKDLKLGQVVVARHEWCLALKRLPIEAKDEPIIKTFLDASLKININVDANSVHVKPISGKMLVVVKDPEIEDQPVNGSSKKIAVVKLGMLDEQCCWKQGGLSFYVKQFIDADQSQEMTRTIVNQVKYGPDLKTDNNKPAFLKLQFAPY
jgi:hypothetical protein